MRTVYLILVAPVLVLVFSVFFFLNSVLQLENSLLEFDTSTPYSFVSSDSGNLSWFVQLSDLHISQFKDIGRVDQLLEFTDTSLHILNPAAVVVTGDLTDAKSENMLSSKQSVEEWEMYRMVVEQAEKTNIWLEVPGNHDRFDVLVRAESDHYSKYRGEAGRTGLVWQGRHYLYLLENRGVKLAFIGVDETPKYGFRAPFNFIGHLNQTDIQDLQVLRQRAEAWTPNIVWFGHYPTSSLIYSNTGLRDIARSGLVYLAGHLHSVYGTARDMYGVHSSGLVEAELEDWKDARMVRLLAVDNGRLTYTDWKHGSWPVVLVTWPPRLGHETKFRKSSHIRLLMFSTKPVSEVLVTIDEGSEERSVQDKSLSNLYTLAWDQDKYNKIHTINIKIVHEDGEISVHKHQFSVTGQGYSSLPILSRLFILLNLTSVFQFLFLVLFCICTLPLVVCRTTLSSHLQDKSCILTRFYLLSSLDGIYLPLILYPLYLAAGPWCIGEMMTSSYGIIFTWGTLFWTETGFTYLPTTTTWLFATVHLAIVHLPVTILLSGLVLARFISLEENGVKNYRIQVYQVLLLLSCLQQGFLVYYQYQAYGVSTLLGGMRAGELVLTIILWRRVLNLDITCFSRYRFSNLHVE